MEVNTMLKFVLMIILATAMAASGNSAAAASKPAAIAEAGQAGAESLGFAVGFLPLDKTWTTTGQENEAGSQVLANSRLTSPVSFSAEGKGFEPSTPCGASDFESDR